VLVTRVPHGRRIDDEIGHRVYDYSDPMAIEWDDYFSHRDDLNTLYATTNEMGDAVERYEYGDYGDVRFADAAGGSRTDTQVEATSLFTGRRPIAGRGTSFGAGVIDYRHRVMEPEVGRFLQRDPLGYRAGMNCFSYTKDAPLVLVDPLGLIPPMTGGPGGVRAGCSSITKSSDWQSCEGIPGVQYHKSCRSRTICQALQHPLMGPILSRVRNSCSGDTRIRCDCSTSGPAGWVPTSPFDNDVRVCQQATVIVGHELIHRAQKCENWLGYWWPSIDDTICMELQAYCHSPLGPLNCDTDTNQTVCNTVCQSVGHPHCFARCVTLRGKCTPNGFAPAPSGPGRLVDPWDLKPMP